MIMASRHAESSSNNFQLSSQRELSLIDRGLLEIPELVNNYRHLVSINLHGNNISVIRGLDQLSDTLRFLDLSSNRIASMNGIANLHELVYLNLASNRLVSVSAISKLCNLRYINLAYNRITGLSGFRQLAISNMGNSVLERIDLQGNCVNSIDLVITALCEFSNLQELHFAKDGSTNPVCALASYRSRILSSIKSIKILDGSDRFGNPILDNGWLQQEDIMSDLVLSLIDNNFMTEMPSSPSKFKSGQTKSSKNSGIRTPHVDAVLAKIRQVQQSELDRMDRAVDNEVEAEEEETENNQQITSPTVSPQKPVKETSDQPKVMALYESRLKELEAELARLKSSVGQQSAAMIQQTVKIADAGVQAQDHLAPMSSHVNPSRPGHKKLQHHHSASKLEDVEQRHEAAKTFSDLVRQIEAERERRFKAEMAAKKLADAVRSMEERIKQCQDITMMTELEHSARLKAEEEVKRLNGHLQVANLRLPELDSLLHKANAETNRQKLELDETSKKLLIAEKRALENEAEAKRLHSQVTDLERRLNDVQATLASREAEHRREVSGRDFTDRVLAIETLWKERLESEKHRTEELSVKYRQLEDEFRDALRIEAGRFDAVEEDLRRVSEEERKTKSNLKVAEQRLAQHQQASAQLTAAIKGLKSKLGEQEKVYLGKINELESQLAQINREYTECRKQAQAAEFLRQEKIKLLAELQALQSVVEGLRSERKHWGEELAKQGAQLSSDRGRLETRIESLTVENGSLKRELDKEVESVKIKTKIIDDQLDTIRKLKDALVDREKELKQARSEIIDLQKQNEEHEAELKESADALETSDRRASELKKRALELQQQLATEKQLRISESEKWRDRITGISELETRVIELQKNATEKEKQLLDDKTKLAMELEAARERIRVLDDRFREQLDLIQVEHARQFERVKNEAQNDVAKAQSRVRQVEDEMRTLLAETEQQRRGMEQRVKQLQAGLSQLVGLDVIPTQNK